ncbi:MAG: 4-(cytidine 5'-diphospho)-2-C-methyl-D-erythritol kinase [Mariprofundaceae bacterium]|nr:4-(cytidine 5'-diphospho)-2-C-methyl-D-erythritol kinase [Mariprofundaceae bacterium]
MTLTISDSTTVLAPAKINLHLNITGIFPDGRHELDTSFAFVDTYDTLHITASKQLSVGCSIASLSGTKNLVFQVLQALKERHRVHQGLDIYIDKKLPSKAGLGGGSSDAASALLAANQMWNLQLSQQNLIDFSAGFGADIPCFLFGRASLATGIGEKLTPYPKAMPSTYICLARPSNGLSTKEVFQHFDTQINKCNLLLIKDKNKSSQTQKRAFKLAETQSSLTHQASADTMRAASQGKLHIGENVLEESAIALLPEVGLLLQAMRQKADLAWMSGSGSTCVALCSTQQQAILLANDLQQKGLASWTHAGRLLDKHPAFTNDIGA